MILPTYPGKVLQASPKPPQRKKFPNRNSRWFGSLRYLPGGPEGEILDGWQKNTTTKYPEPVKTGYFEDQNTPVMQVQTLPLKGQMILRPKSCPLQSRIITSEWRNSTQNSPESTTTTTTSTTTSTITSTTVGGPGGWVVGRDQRWLMDEDKSDFPKQKTKQW